MRHKIAFHLGRGANYMHWQIKTATGEVVYVNPNTHDIVLKGCLLKNRKSASRKIFEGADKERCAWVEFDSWEVTERKGFTSETHVRFNPRVSPTWMVNGESDKDNTTFEVLFTNQHNLYA